MISDKMFDTKHPKLYAVDMDGTLTNGERYWNTKKEPTPNLKMINWINEKYMQGHHIIIYTARPYEEIRETVSWLIKYGVLYHGLNFDKMGADLYIDDKAINTEVIINGKNNINN